LQAILQLAKAPWLAALARRRGGRIIDRSKGPSSIDRPEPQSLKRIR
jgi:hypothetical protein